MFLFLGLGNRNLLWYRDFLGRWEKQYREKWKMHRICESRYVNSNPEGVQKESSGMKWIKDLPSTLICCYCQFAIAKNQFVKILTWIKKKLGILMKHFFIYKIIAKNFGFASTSNFGLNDNRLKIDLVLIWTGNGDVLWNHIMFLLN